MSLGSDFSLEPKALALGRFSEACAILVTLISSIEDLLVARLSDEGEIDVLARFRLNTDFAPNPAALPYIVQVLLLIAAQLAYGADYAREKKWADEITPGIVVGDPVYLEGRAGHRFLTIYTEAPNAKAGLVIVHGTGVHPDHGLISTLRTALADRGYTTLSVQMPVLAQEAKPEDYPPTFGEAGERLKVAVEFLRAKGYRKIAIVSHSLGSRMTYYYLSRDPIAAVNAWVCIGWGGEDFRQIKFPVLDLYGENDLPAVLKGAERRAASIKNSKRSQQIMAPKTDHFFNGHQAELVKYVKDFLDKSL